MSSQVYRVGAGHSASGKILDRDTQWFTKYDSALEYAKQTKKNIYMSVNNKKYVKIS